jgi:ABC-type multidrug transport system ATPase subunit
MLAVRGLGRLLGNRWLFRNLEFELGLGDCLIVSGNNGSGKSTLLRMLAGLDSPTEGSVHPEGQVGYSAIDQAVYPNLSCAEQVRLICDLRGVEDHGVLKLVQLEYATDVLASQLSSGMRARLRLALALVHRPDILLLDEPSATLDADGISQLSKIIQDQKERGLVVLATNDPHERRWGTVELNLSEAG